VSVDDLRWKKSSWSAPDNNCVEVAFRGGEVLARDSKSPGEARLGFSVRSWAAFIGRLQVGDLDRKIN
jgi:hypothetical protein